MKNYKKKRLTNFTKDDVWYVKNNPSRIKCYMDHKRYLITELHENYKLDFTEISELLGDHPVSISVQYTKNFNHKDL